MSSAAEHFGRPVARLPGRTASCPRRRPCPWRIRRSAGSARSPWAAGCAGALAYTSGSCSLHPQDLGRGEAGQRIVAGRSGSAARCPALARISSHWAPVRWSFHRMAGRSTSPAGVQQHQAVHLPGQADGGDGFAGDSGLANTAADALTTMPAHQSAGSCSDHSGRGLDSVSGVRCRRRRPAPSDRSAAPSRRWWKRRVRGGKVVDVRPHGRRLTARRASSFNRQLIEPLVGQAARAQRRPVEGRALRPLGLFRCVLAGEMGQRPIIGVDLGQQRLDLGVGIPARGLLLEDQVGAHAAAREVLDAFVILGAIGVGVEVAAALRSRRLPGT